MKIVIEILDTINKNNRFYPKELFETYKFPEESFVYLNAKLGENTTNTITHRVSNIRVEGNCLVADLELLDTPAAKIIKDLTEAGVSVNFGLSGTGQLEKDGTVFDYRYDHLLAYI